LRRACLDAVRWPIALAVNVSPLQFRRPNFVEMVERILAETKFEASRLELEITESTLLGNVEGAEAAMRRLKALGVRLALDDFGTGYSSLLYLRRFPFDKIKIDRSFMAGFDGSGRNAETVMKTIIALGRELHMRVTVEGVETAKQAAFLEEADGDEAQGFYFGRPVNPSEVDAILANLNGVPPTPATTSALKKPVLID